jgi:hypothetical protein
MFGVGSVPALHIIGLIGRVVFDNFRRVSIVIARRRGFISRQERERGLASEIAVYEVGEDSADAMRGLSG